MRIEKSDEFKRWENKVLKTDDCWIWTGAKLRKGYGHFRRFIDGKWVMYKAHRYAYEYFKKTIPHKMQVCHSCDNPSCVNPEHLWVGTANENVQDKMQKGRFVLGRRGNCNNLNFEIAEQIREYAKHNAVKYPVIAKVFNTSIPQICRILNNKIWKAGTEN